MGVKFNLLMAATVLLALSDIGVVAANKKKEESSGNNATTKKPAITDEEVQPEVSSKSNVSTKVDQYTRHLKFDADNTFRVVQFSDIWVNGDA